LAFTVPLSCVTAPIHIVGMPVGFGGTRISSAANERSATVPIPAVPSRAKSRREIRFIR
jgi:precorrin isomerase